MIFHLIIPPDLILPLLPPGSDSRVYTPYPPYAYPPPGQSPPTPYPPTPLGRAPPYPPTPPPGESLGSQGIIK